MLVSGASGLVGSAAVAALAARGHRVRALVRNGAPGPGVDEVVVGDVADQGAWTRALAGIDAVVHAAGAMTQDPATLHAVNERGAQVAAAAVRDAGHARLVLLSSAAVYAAGPMLDADEDTPLAPADPYGQSKLSGERAARAALGERVTILRPVSVYATHRPSPFLAAVRAVAAARRLPLIDGGRTPIDLVHADDLAGAIVAAIEGRGAGGVFNVPGAETAPFLELARLAAAVLGVEVEVVSTDDSAPDGCRGGFDGWLLEVAAIPRTVAGQRARTALVYAPTRGWRYEIAAALAAHAPST